MPVSRFHERNLPRGLENAIERLRDLEDQVEIQELMILELSKAMGFDQEVFKADMQRRLDVAKKLRQKEDYLGTDSR